jgi:glycosyltransferase involved in cell wall biosynthesis
LPNGVDTDYFQPSDKPNGRAVVFTGKLSYHANVAAALRLVQRIMPLVWRHEPDTPVILGGKSPPSAVLALARDRRVIVTGFVADIRGVFAQAAVAVCPLVYGGGIQNKLLEAMAYGVATVCAEGPSRALLGQAGRDYLTGEGDVALAECILDVLADPDLRAQLGASGRAYVCSRHQWRQLAAGLVNAYSSAAALPLGSRAS